MAKPRRSAAEIEQAELEDKIQLSGQKALLKALEEDASPTTLRIWSERNAEKLAAALKRIEELGETAGDTAELDAAVAAKNAAEAELAQVKADWNATVNAEVRKVRDEVSTAQAALTQREVVIKRAEATIKANTDVALIRLAFDFLSSLVRRMESWTPTEFFDPEIPKSPWIWRTWWPEDRAKLWCAWENEIAAMPREKQIGTIAHEIHVRGCMYHKNSKTDLTQERKEFLDARIRYMGIDTDVFEINRSMTDYCRQHGQHPLPANIDYEFGARRNMQTKMITGDLPSYL